MSVASSFYFSEGDPNSLQEDKEISSRRPTVGKGSHPSSTRNGSLDFQFVQDSTIADRLSGILPLDTRSSISFGIIGEADVKDSPPVSTRVGRRSSRNQFGSLIENAGGRANSRGRHPNISTMDGNSRDDKMRGIPPLTSSKSNVLTSEEMTRSHPTTSGERRQVERASDVREAGEEEQREEMYVKERGNPRVMGKRVPLEQHADPATGHANRNRADVPDSGEPSEDTSGNMRSAPFNRFLKALMDASHGENQKGGDPGVDQTAGTSAAAGSHHAARSSSSLSPTLPVVEAAPKSVIPSTPAAATEVPLHSAYSPHFSSAGVPSVEHHVFSRMATLPGVRAGGSTPPLPSPTTASRTGSTTLRKGTGKGKSASPLARAPRQKEEMTTHAPRTVEVMGDRKGRPLAGSMGTGKREGEEEPMGGVGPVVPSSSSALGTSSGIKSVEPSSKSREGPLSERKDARGRRRQKKKVVDSPPRPPPRRVIGPPDSTNTTPRGSRCNTPAATKSREMASREHVSTREEREGNGSGLRGGPARSHPSSPAMVCDTREERAVSSSHRTSSRDRRVDVDRRRHATPQGLPEGIGSVRDVNRRLISVAASSPTPPPLPSVHLAGSPPPPPRETSHNNSRTSVPATTKKNSHSFASFMKHFFHPSQKSEQGKQKARKKKNGNKRVPLTAFEYDHRTSTSLEVSSIANVRQHQESISEGVSDIIFSGLALTTEDPPAGSAVHGSRAERVPSGKPAPHPAPLVHQGGSAGRDMKSSMDGVLDRERGGRVPTADAGRGRPSSPRNGPHGARSRWNAMASGEDPSPDLVEATRRRGKGERMGLPGGGEQEEEVDHEEGAEEDLESSLLPSNRSLPHSEELTPEEEDLKERRRRKLAEHKVKEERRRKQKERNDDAENSMLEVLLHGRRPEGRRGEGVRKEWSPDDTEENRVLRAEYGFHKTAPSSRLNDVGAISSALGEGKKREEGKERSGGSMQHSPEKPRSSFFFPDERASSGPREMGSPTKPQGRASATVEEEDDEEDEQLFGAEYKEDIDMKEFTLSLPSGEKAAEEISGRAKTMESSQEGDAAKTPVPKEAIAPTFTPLDPSNGSLSSSRPQKSKMEGKEAIAIVEALSFSTLPSATDEGKGGGVGAVPVIQGRAIGPSLTTPGSDWGLPGYGPRNSRVVIHEEEGDRAHSRGGKAKEESKGSFEFIVTDGSTVKDMGLPPETCPLTSTNGWSTGGSNKRGQGPIPAPPVEGSHTFLFLSASGGLGSGTATGEEEERKAKTSGRKKTTTGAMTGREGSGGKRDAKELEKKEGQKGRGRGGETHRRATAAGTEHQERKPAEKDMEWNARKGNGRKQDGPHHEKRPRKGISSREESRLAEREALLEQEVQRLDEQLSRVQKRMCLNAQRLERRGCYVIPVATTVPVAGEEEGGDQQALPLLLPLTDTTMDVPRMAAMHSTTWSQHSEESNPTPRGAVPAQYTHKTHSTSDRSPSRTEEGDSPSICAFHRRDTKAGTSEGEQDEESGGEALSYQKGGTSTAVVPPTRHSQGREELAPSLSSPGAAASAWTPSSSTASAPQRERHPAPTPVQARRCIGLTEVEQNTTAALREAERRRQERADRQLGSETLEVEDGLPPPSSTSSVQSILQEFYDSVLSQWESTLSNAPFPPPPLLSVAERGGYAGLPTPSPAPLLRSSTGWITSSGTSSVLGDPQKETEREATTGMPYRNVDPSSQLEHREGTERPRTEMSQPKTDPTPSPATCLLTPRPHEWKDSVPGGDLVQEENQAAQRPWSGFHEGEASLSFYALSILALLREMCCSPSPPPPRAASSLTAKKTRDMTELVRWMRGMRSCTRSSMDSTEDNEQEEEGAAKEPSAPSFSSSEQLDPSLRNGSGDSSPSVDSIEIECMEVLLQEVLCLRLYPFASVAVEHATYSLPSKEDSPRVATAGEGNREARNGFPDTGEEKDAIQGGMKRTRNTVELPVSQACVLSSMAASLSPLLQSQNVKRTEGRKEGDGTIEEEEDGASVDPRCVDELTVILFIQLLGNIYCHMVEERRRQTREEVVQKKKKEEEEGRQKGDLERYTDGIVGGEEQSPPATPCVPSSSSGPRSSSPVSFRISYPHASEEPAHERAIATVNSPTEFALLPSVGSAARFPGEIEEERVPDPEGQPPSVKETGESDGAAAEQDSSSMDPTENSITPMPCPPRNEEPAPSTEESPLDERNQPSVEPIEIHHTIQSEVDLVPMSMGMTVTRPATDEMESEGPHPRQEHHETANAEAALAVLPEGMGELFPLTKSNESINGMGHTEGTTVPFLPHPIPSITQAKEHTEHHPEGDVEGVRRESQTTPGAAGTPPVDPKGVAQTPPALNTETTTVDAATRADFLAGRLESDPMKEEIFSEFLHPSEISAASASGFPSTGYRWNASTLVSSSANRREARERELQVLEKLNELEARLLCRLPSYFESGKDARGHVVAVRRRGAGPGEEGREGEEGSERRVSARGVEEEDGVALTARREWRTTPYPSSGVEVKKELLFGGAGRHRMHHTLRALASREGQEEKEQRKWMVESVERSQHRTPFSNRTADTFLSFRSTPRDMAMRKGWGNGCGRLDVEGSVPGSSIALPFTAVSMESGEEKEKGREEETEGWLQRDVSAVPSAGFPPAVPPLPLSMLSFTSPSTAAHGMNAGDPHDMMRSVPSPHEEKKEAQREAGVSKSDETHKEELAKPPPSPHSPALMDHVVKDAPSASNAEEGGQHAEGSEEMAAPLPTALPDAHDSFSSNECDERTDPTPMKGSKSATSSDLSSSSVSTSTDSTSSGSPFPKKRRARP